MSTVTSIQARFCRLLRCAVTLSALLALVAVSPRCTTANSVSEYQVKAAFLLNFAKFIEWPPDALPDIASPITFCVFRHDPFGSDLENAVRGKTINSRELLTRRVKALPDLKACLLVFVSSQENKSLQEILNNLKGSGVLVVGESEEFAERGGGFEFYMEDNKVRFSANLDALQRARLTVSSKLLALARIVHEKNHAKGT